ncbi:MAG: hypothetical protein AABX05_03585, partial [Nanoarchaeota archaeon]
MRWMKGLFLFLSMLIIVSAAAAAQSTVTSEPIKNEISMLEEATFKLTITNNADKVQRYTIYALQSGQSWNVDPYPLKDKIIELAPGASQTTTIIADVLQELPPGIYFIHVTIQSDLGESYSESLKVYLKPKQPIDYLAAIKATIDMDDKIDPRNPVSVKLFLENRNQLNISGLKIMLQSEIPEFEQELTVDIPPMQKKTVELSIMPNPYQQPKDYVLFFVFERNGETIKIVQQKMEIISIMPPFEVTSSEEKFYFKNFKTLFVKNTGNVRNTQIVKEPVSAWKYLFIKSEGKMLIEDGQRSLSWEVALSPGEEIAIPVIINYRVPLYLLLAALIFAIFYWYVQSPVSVHKTALTTKGNEDGSLSEIKITIELRNHSKKPIKEVLVTDLV